MLYLAGTDPLALAVEKAIHTGDVPALKRLLTAHPELAQARIGDACAARTLLHIATDWPGHFSNGAAIVALLVEAGADVNARFTGAHAETPLHWAASSNDVAVLDALLDAGADIEATGAVIGGGTPLADARGFAQWEAAHRLVERGARTTLNDAATLGLMERLEAYFAADAPPVPPTPEDKYNFVPTAGDFRGVRNFAKQLKHTGAVIQLVSAGILGEKEPADAADERGPDSARTKAEIIKYLRDSYAYLRKAAATIDEKNAFEPLRNPFGKTPIARISLVNAVVHSANHYGQMAEYLRMNHIKPRGSM